MNQKIRVAQAYIVMSIDKAAFNGMGKINPDDINLIPVSGFENETAVYTHFHENMKHLKIMGVASLEYLRYQEQLILEHLKENNLEIDLSDEDPNEADEAGGTKEAP